MCDALLLENCELLDHTSAFSTRATLSAECLTLCRAAEWMKTAFVSDDAFGELCADVSVQYLQSNIRYAMDLRNGLQRRANRATVSMSPQVVFKS